MLSEAAVLWIDQIEACHHDLTLTEPQRELMLIGMFAKFADVMGGPVVSCKGDCTNVLILNPLLPQVGEGEELKRTTSYDEDEDVDDDITPSLDD
jgi:hypothetical protein